MHEAQKRNQRESQKLHIRISSRRREGNSAEELPRWSERHQRNRGKAPNSAISAQLLPIMFQRTSLFLCANGRNVFLNICCSAQCLIQLVTQIHVSLMKQVTLGKSGHGLWVFHRFRWVLSKPYGKAAGDGSKQIPRDRRPEFMPSASSSCMKPKTAWKETPECTSSEVPLLKSFVGVEASVAPQQAGLFSSREPAQ